jgi:DNA mismatch endonuclease (patch repair protein)
MFLQSSTEVAHEGEAMADRLSVEARSRLMSKVGGKNTAPELAVRKAAHAAGMRFRLHRRDLPGTPDIVFPRYHVAVFVHGCFWHGHGCTKGRLPKSRKEYWEPKIAANRERDAIKRTALEAVGWRVLTVWECELGRPEEIVARLEDFFHGKESDRQPRSASV